MRRGYTRIYAHAKGRDAKIDIDVKLFCQTVED
jgi:hypothetical protein